MFYFIQSCWSRTSLLSDLLIFLTNKTNRWQRLKKRNETSNLGHCSNFKYHKGAAVEQKFKKALMTCILPDVDLCANENEYVLSLRVNYLHGSIIWLQELYFVTFLGMEVNLINVDTCESNPWLYGECKILLILI